MKLKILKWPNRYRINRKYNDFQIYFESKPSKENLPDWSKGGLIGLSRLLKFLEEKYGFGNFTIIFTRSNHRFYFTKSNVVKISLPKWIGFIRELDKISGNYKISKYYFNLWRTCRGEGIKNFFSNLPAESIIPTIENTVVALLELFLSEFDSLNEAEQKALLRNVENSRVGAIILKRHGKLDKSSPKKQLKSVIANINKLNTDELSGLLNTLVRSKKALKILERIKRLPTETQSLLLKNVDESAKLLFVYNKLKQSLNDFKAKIKRHASSSKKDEHEIHAFLAEEYWLLDIGYFGQVIKTDINPAGKKTGETYQAAWRIYPDFEIQKTNGSTDICICVELEEANDKIFNKNGSLSKGVLEGIFQAITYTVYKKIEEKKYSKGIAVIGYTGKINNTQKNKLNSLRELLPNIEILTYDDLIQKAKTTLKFLKQYAPRSQIEVKKPRTNKS